jgi:hypothetical protein
MPHALMRAMRAGLAGRPRAKPGCAGLAGRPRVKPGCVGLVGRPRAKPMRA